MCNIFQYSYAKVRFIYRQKFVNHPLLMTTVKIPVRMQTVEQQMQTALHVISYNN